MTNLAFYAKDKDDVALFLVRFYEEDGEVHSSTTHLKGGNHYSTVGPSNLVWWAGSVLRAAHRRVAPRKVHHYEVVGE